LKLVPRKNQHLQKQQYINKLEITHQLIQGRMNWRRNTPKKLGMMRTALFLHRLRASGDAKQLQYHLETDCQITQVATSIQSQKPQPGVLQRKPRQSERRR